MDIKYSVSNWIYGEEPIEKHFKRLKEYGYDAIELMVSNPKEFNLKKIQELMEQYALPCSSICTMMNYSENHAECRNLIHKNSEVRKRTVNYLKGCLDIGAELSANLVLVVPSGVGNVKDGWNEENKNLCVKALIELGDHAKSGGTIQLAIEPINRYENAFLRRCEQAKELLALSNHEYVKMMLDFFHTNIEEDNNADAIRLANEDLIHCHIADSNRKSTGRGQTNWFEIFRALRDIDFQGALACEPLPPSGANVYVSLKGVRAEADQYAEECILFLRFIKSVI
ncbi:MAG: Xylose isomerase [Promethearchaeota archaeon]|nr:MAG: Xylose isomerase [Candidatus Lokiarchaeota archaeon]